MSKDNYSRRDVIGSLGAAALATSVVGVPTADAEVVSPFPTRRVIRYKFGWNNRIRVGRIILQLDSPPEPVILETDSPQEFLAILTVLKDEPVYHNLNGWLRTGAEEIG